MTRLAPEDRIVPYGTSRLDTRALSVSRAADGSREAHCRTPHVVLRPQRRDPLRLNDAPYDFTGRPAPREATPDTDHLELLRVRVEDFCDLWAAPKRRFVAAYFAFAARQVERHAEELTRRLAPFGGLYRPRDWVFSALAPLPRAWLHAPGAGAPARDPTPEDFVPVDFAFWTGTHAVAVHIPGSATPTHADRERRERLEASGVETVEVGAATLRAEPADALETLLPAPLRRFWEGEPFPAGPFRNSHLGDL